MKLFIVFLVLFALIFLVAGDIVQKNIICVEEIKALEKCLNEAGEGQGWCYLGNTVIFQFVIREHFAQFLQKPFFLDSAKAADVCKALMQKMNECIKGKSST